MGKFFKKLMFSQTTQEKSYVSEPVLPRTIRQLSEKQLRIYFSVKAFISVIVLYPVKVVK